MPSSRILLCMFLLLVTNSLLHAEATFHSSSSPSLAAAAPPSRTPFGCDHSSCKTTCCLCTVVRTRPVCGRCCEEVDKTRPGGSRNPPKAAPAPAPAPIQV